MKSSDTACECCGQEVPMRCEYGDCRRTAMWEAWFRGGGMVRRLNVCNQHIKLSIGRMAGKPLADDAVDPTVDSGSKRPRA